MNLLSLRDRIRTKAIANSLTYTEIETLFDVNELLNQTMPCLAWRYSGETNNFDEVGTEMSLNIYLLTEFPDSVKTETADYQRDYIVTQQDALRTFFYTWLQAMPFESGSDFLEVLSTEEIPIAERLSINAFLTMEFRVNISIKRDFCVEPEEIAPTEDEVKVYFNSVLKYTQACNVDLQLTLKNQDGDDITAAFTGYDIVVTQPVAADARVSNSDDTYDVNVASGGDLELPDITVSNSDDSYSVTYPSVQDVELPDETINIVDENGNPLDSITFPVYTDPNIDITSYCPPPVGATLMKTGQTTSYRTGDDGDLQEGRATDFDTLASNNPFGNTNRFTDELGGTAYANDIVIDWSTYNNSTVLGYYRIPLPSNTWANQIDACLALSISTFTSGWRMANYKEFDNIHSKDDTLVSGRFDALNYTPFNINLGNYLSTSTSRDGSFSIGYLLNPFGNFGINLISKSSSYQCIAVRTFTVSGTILT